jgi:hypothetical protein
MALILKEIGVAVFTENHSGVLLLIFYCGFGVVTACLSIAAYRVETRLRAKTV